ncbi:hypothetical protein A3G16_01965 [Candidatus Curtissbacteria bacterium RIFCSPLOWO2_12_FULL_41_16]|nr:MAG: hypothetical protein A3G16_01965 [Candidatus Curtissbacteria bacterium RIFCSPLOWO2_12_FULL_41_16]
MVYKLSLFGKIDFESLYFLLIFIVVLLIHLLLSTIGWNNTINDHHGFRQTQTAITAYYVLKDGFRLDYLTPVLGKPWSIPMEFPLFQWLVALLVMGTKINLDSAGRLLSITFFYLSLVPIYFLLDNLITKKRHIFVFLSLILASPVYIFWSRTFMIESLAMFLGFVFLVIISKLASKPKVPILLLAIVVGVLAALVKITTFAIFDLAAIFLFLRFWRGRVSVGRIIQFLLTVGTPLVVNFGWVYFSDYLKAQNEFAAGFITSGAMRFWNFGTLAQRFSYDSWVGVFNLAGPNIWGMHFVQSSFLTLIFIIIFYTFNLLLKGKYCKETFAFFLLFLAGPLIFTNLYIVHDYYWYANAVFLLFSLGFLINSFLNISRLKIVAKFIVLPVILLTMYQAYFARYYSIQKFNNVAYLPLANAIKYFTKPDDILLIHGFDWSSEIPYYSQRRALMDRWNLPFESSKFQLALKNLGDEKISAMVLRRDASVNEKFIAERIKKLNLSGPVFKDQDIELYITGQY